MAHYLKYYLVFGVFYVIASLAGVSVAAAMTKFAGVNPGTVVSVFVYFVALAAALRMGDGIFPHRLDRADARVTADIRTHGLALAAGFAIIASAFDLVKYAAISLNLNGAVQPVSLKQMALLAGSYALIALITLKFESEQPAEG